MAFKCVMDGSVCEKVWQLVVASQLHLLKCGSCYVILPRSSHFMAVVENGMFSDVSHSCIPTKLGAERGGRICLNIIIESGDRSGINLPFRNFYL